MYERNDPPTLQVTRSSGIVNYVKLLLYTAPTKCTSQVNSRRCSTV